MGKGPSPGTKLNQTPNANNQYMGVRLRVIRFVVEREKAQNVS